MSGMEILLGAAGTAGTAGAAGVAATTGLFGTAGSFALAPTLSTIGSAMGVVGALNSGRSEQAAANYNAQSAQMDAAAKEAAQRRDAARQQGALRASLAKSGTSMEGTPLMVMAESAANAELDALNTRITGQRESTLYRMRGSNAATASRWQAGTSLLTGLSKIK